MGGPQFDLSSNCLHFFQGMQIVIIVIVLLVNMESEAIINNYFILVKCCKFQRAWNKTCLTFETLPLLLSLLFYYNKYCMKSVENNKEIVGNTKLYHVSNFDLKYCKHNYFEQYSSIHLNVQISFLLKIIWIDS